jgi:DNA processing protein
VAIVGTRRCTFYGEQTAYRLSRDLAERGVTVISGLALGIDMAAHSGALAGGGHTVAVLGCGLDISYPPENADLQRQISQKGTLLSEFSFGRPVDRRSFAIRNRIITGLAGAVVVVESPRTGGSMLSARFARQQNRPLLAVPGRIGEESGAGCNDLIREGALLCRSGEDILEALTDFPVSRQAGTGSQGVLDFPDIHGPPVSLTESERKIWTALGNGPPRDADGLAADASLPPLECAQILQSWILGGWVRRDLAGTYSMIPGASAKKN